MDLSKISKDDVQDIVEMSGKLENYFTQVFDETETRLCMSALIGSVINTMITQCDSLDHFIIYRDIFVDVMDGAIRNAKNKE